MIKNAAKTCVDAGTRVKTKQITLSKMFGLEPKEEEKKEEESIFKSKVDVLGDGKWQKK